MVMRSLQAAAVAMGGQVIAGDPAASWRGASIDSRRLEGGEIFFALPGEQVDGHRFAAAAAEKAGAVVVHEEIDPSGTAGWIRVDDTYQALHALTRAVRSEVPQHLVGITGSAGKTTTKEILAALLAQRFQAARSPGNFNNLYGFPLALLGLPDDCEWMVAEMGMSVPGELAEVSRLGRPDVALFTNVKPVHLANFENVRGIAEAKSELLAGLAPNGTVIANADDPEVRWIVETHARHAGQVIWYGVEAEEVDLRLLDFEARSDRPGSRFRLLAADGSAVACESDVHGFYNARNALAAAACALTLGVSLEEISAALAEFQPAQQRGVVEKLGNVVLIDDSYNSNPAAVREALQSAHSLHAKRRIAVLGDMLELGPREDEFHHEAGALAAQLGFVTAGVGKLAASLAQAAGGTALADAEDAAQWICETVRPGDLVLVKGSRGVGLEKAVEALRQQLGGES